jgi:hypothetical protein
MHKVIVTNGMLMIGRGDGSIGGHRDEDGEAT